MYQVPFIIVYGKVFVTTSLCVSGTVFLLFSEVSESVLNGLTKRILKNAKHFVPHFVRY